MAQPTGQVLLDTGGPYYGYFWYANDTGLWDARAGAMATKSGTGAVVSEGGANVITGDGSTYFTLPSLLTLAGDFTIGFKCRLTAANTASIIAGDRTVGTDFIWVNNGSNQIAIRANNGTVTAANTNSATLTTYHLTRSGTVYSLYKGGSFVSNFSTQNAQPLDIGHLLAGYTNGSFSINGVMEWFHLINGTALDATAISSLAADPYQVLVSAGASAEISLTTEAATFSGSASQGSPVASVSVTTVGATFSGSAETAGAAGTIALIAPVDRQSFQRDINGQADVTLIGTYAGGPESIEYRHAGGSWATLVASPTGGSFSETVTLSTGQGALEVRFSDNTDVTDSALLVTVGEGFMVAGQSNNAGRAANTVQPVPDAFTALEYSRAGEWIPLQESASNYLDSFDTAQYGAGSYFGALSNLLQANGVPVWFVPCAIGSTGIEQWQRYDADPDNTYFPYGNLLTRANAVGDHRALLWWQGENEAVTGMSQSEYEGWLNALIDDWYADTGRPTFIIKICTWTAGAATVRAAQDAVIASNPHVAGYADGAVYTPGVHYNTVTDINNVADAVYAGMVDAFYTTSATITSSTSSATVAMSGFVSPLASLSSATLNAVFSGAAGTIAAGAISATTGDSTAVLSAFVSPVAGISVAAADASAALAASVYSGPLSLTDADLDAIAARVVAAMLAAGPFSANVVQFNNHPITGRGVRGDSIRPA